MPGGEYRAPLRVGRSESPNSRYQCVVAPGPLAEQFAKSRHARDDKALGELLGFPSCCIESFIEIWKNQQKIDPTRAMAVRSSNTTSHHLIQVRGFDETNILFRWFGIRAVPHWPCSFDCKYARDLGSNFLKLGHEIGCSDQVNTIRNLLSLRVQWSACEGVAEVESPIGRIRTTTDYDSERTTVVRLGREVIGTLDTRAAQGDQPQRIIRSHGAASGEEKS